MRLISADKCFDFNYEVGTIMYDDENKRLAFTINLVQCVPLIENISKERAVEIMWDMRTAFRAGDTFYECPQE